MSNRQERGLTEEFMTDFKPIYSPWRHGGWYVNNVRHANGGCGCVSNNYPDGKWRIVCDDRDPQPTYATRHAAAMAEYELASAAIAKETAA